MTTGAIPPPPTGAAPPSAMSIAGEMIGRAVRSTPAKVVYGVLAALIVAAMIASGISNGPGGAFGALLVSGFVLFGIAFFLAIPTFIVVLIIASQRARRVETGAMQAYARFRSLSYAPAGSLPEATPLLSAGWWRETQDIMTGILPGGLHGTLAHFTYSVSSGTGETRTG